MSEPLHKITHRLWMTTEQLEKMMGELNDNADPRTAEGLAALIKETEEEYEGECEKLSVEYEEVRGE